MKENNSGSFSSNPNLRILLICACTALISGAGGYLLGFSNFYQLGFSQTVAAITVNTPSANQTSQTTLSTKTAESLSQSPSNTANNKIQDLEERLKNAEEQLKNTKDYSKSIIDTVFPTILGTVLTILAFQWITNIWNHDRDKKEIELTLKEWLKGKPLEDIQNEIDDNLQLILCNQIDQIFSRIEIKTKWLEYQIAVLAAEQMEMEQSQTPNIPTEHQEIQQNSRQPILLQQRIQAIRALQYLESNHQGSEIKYCLEEELAAVKYILEKITSDNLNKTPILYKQMKEIDEMLFKVDACRTYYGREVNEITQKIKQLRT